MKKMNWLAVAAAGAMILTSVPTMTFAQGQQEIPQGTGSAVLENANYFGDMDPSAVVSVDFVLKVQNKDKLAQYIKDTTSPGSAHYRQYLSPTQFKAQFAPQPASIKTVTDFLASYGIKASTYADNLVITATGTVGQFNKALSVEIQKASFNGKTFHASKKNPTVPANVADQLLCVLGLSDYSSLTSQSVARPGDASAANVPTGYMPNTLQDHYNVNPLYAKGATGKGQTIGIVTLADFNPQDAYNFWSYNNIKVDPNRIDKINVDGGSGTNGADETSLDVEQSGALAPGANINVYVAPNTDSGFLDAFARAVNDNVAQQVSASWGESETIVKYSVETNQETPEYEEAFNQLFMQGAAQGISMFTAAGDSGAYSAERDLGTYEVSTLFPASSPYITAAGGTTLATDQTITRANVLNGSNVTYHVVVPKERAWGWDYVYPFFDQRGLFQAGLLGNYFAGGGGGFSNVFATPDYQQGVSGVNTYTAVKQWTGSDPNGTGFLTDVTRDAGPTTLTGTGTGRNLPDLSMNADPYTGYAVLYNGSWATYGGTSFVAPQLAGLSALINSANGGQAGFWNPQLYRFATEANSPLHPLNDSGTSNDNGFFTGTPGTLYNQATGLGTPDVAALAEKLK